MGILNWLFKQPQQDSYPRLTSSIAILRIAIFGRLSETYKLRMRNDERSLWALVVMNSALVESDADFTEEVKRFRLRNARVLEREARNLCQDQVLAKALSYTYAAMILADCIEQQSPVTAKGSALTARATELQLYIPNTYDICGSGDVFKCITAIEEFAKSFAKAF